MSMNSTAAKPRSEGRYNFYHNIHKALRLGHCRNLAAIGATDFTNEAVMAGLLAQLRQFLVPGKGHLYGENREIHTALESRVPGASALEAGHP